MGIDVFKIALKNNFVPLKVTLIPNVLYTNDNLCSIIPWPIRRELCTWVFGRMGPVLKDPNKNFFFCNYKKTIVFKHCGIENPFSDCSNLTK